MGAGQSTGQDIAGSSMGYQVLRVYPNSPGSQAGLKAYFDFIIAIGGTRFNKENGSLREILKASVDQKLKMVVYDTRSKKTREVDITPSTRWGGNGLLGVSIKHASFGGADERVWHVIDVEAGSPAQQAGLLRGEDYVIGSDSILQENDDLYNLIEAHDGKALKLFVYNVNGDNCREVICHPNSKWGGKGYMGCEFGHGLLHRIPYIDPDAPNLKPGERPSYHAPHTILGQAPRNFLVQAPQNPVGQASQNPVSQPPQGSLVQTPQNLFGQPPQSPPGQPPQNLTGQPPQNLLRQPSQPMPGQAPRSFIVQAPQNPVVQASQNPAEQALQNTVGQAPQSLFGQPPQNLLRQPPQNLLGQPPQTILGQPAQNPLGQPPQNLLGQPPQNLPGHPPQNLLGQPPQTILGQPPQTILEQAPQAARIAQTFQRQLLQQDSNNQVREATPPIRVNSNGSVQEASAPNWPHHELVP